MHGRIRQLKSGSAGRSASGDLCDNRAAFLEAGRRTDYGGIDHDFYRYRARKNRARVMRVYLRRPAPMMRPLIVAALVVVTIWMMPTRAEDCAGCTPAFSAPVTP